MNTPKMITGGACGATFLLPDTCILKQTELAEILKKNKEVDKRPEDGGTAGIRTNSYSVRYFALKACHGCEVGLKLYQKFLKEGKPMGTQTKLCPCGETITRYEKQKGVSWRRTKYCEKCREMTQYKRDQLFKPSKQKGIKIVNMPSKNPIKKKLVPMSDPEFLPEKKPESVKEKTCVECRKSFPATLEYFQVGKKKEKLDILCKTCRNIARRAYRAKRREVFALDVSFVPGLLDALADKAEQNMRTPELQALWMLKEALGVG